MQVTDEMYANMAKGMRFAAYQTFFSILIAGPIFSVILAGILYGVFAVLMGGPGDVQAAVRRLRAFDCRFRRRTALHRAAELLPRLDVERDQSGGRAADDRRPVASSADCSA